MSHLFSSLGRGETKTVQDMRGDLKEIDLDFNRKVAFIEYLLFKYKKTLKELFSAKPNAAALAKLEKAVAQVFYFNFLLSFYLFVIYFLFSFIYLFLNSSFSVSCCLRREEEERREDGGS